MFGIVYTLLGGMAKLGYGISDCRKSNEAKHQAKLKGKKYYTDAKGVMRLLSNDHPAGFGYNKYDELCLYDLSTNTVAENISKRNDLARAQKQIEKGKKIVKISSANRSCWDIKGDRYKNIENGEIYVLRGIHIFNPKSVLEYEYYGAYYMKLDGMLALPWEESKTVLNYDVDKFIKEFNKRRLDDKRKNDDNPFVKSLYYNSEKFFFTDWRHEDYE